MGSTLSRLLSVLTVATFVLALTASSALAKPEEIAYRCDVDICLVDPDNTSAVVNLTDNGSKSLDEHPSWSPDGTRVAFVGTEGDKTQNIFTMRPGQGEASNIATQLTYYTGNVYGNDISELAWSPDGTRLAYSRVANYGNVNGVYVVASDGTTATPVTIAAEGKHPSWAPDGGKIAFAKGDTIETTNPDGSNALAPLAGGSKAEEPAWSPDGAQIAFGTVAYYSTYKDLHINPAPGCGPSPVVLTIPYPAEYTQWIDAAWSPAGDRVAYRSTHENGTGYYRVTGRYGEGDHPLVKVQKVNMGGGIPPSWSPDGLRLTFGGYDFSGTPKNEVYVGNSDGSGSITSITSGGKSYEPVWRSDPLRTPQVPVICKSAEGPPGSPPGTKGPVGGNSPGGQRAAKVLWFTKRIPYTPGRPIFVASYGCGGPSCGMNSVGAMKGVAPPSLIHRPARPQLLARKGKKPKQIVVAKGKMTVPGGATKPLKMTLTPAGVALIKSQGKLTFSVTVTTTSPGLPTVTDKHTVTVVYAKPRKH